MIKFSPIMDYGPQDVDLLIGRIGVYTGQRLEVLRNDSNHQAL